MAVLLTGGTGYIGSHVAVELLQAGEEIVIVDDLSNSDEKVLDSLEKITGRRPKFYLGDLKDSAVCEKIFSENDIECVMNFAGYKAVGESVLQPVKYYRNNIDITLSLLEAMKKYGCENFIFSSSATVYGENNPVPYTEEMPTGKCSNPYGWTKSFIEQILLDEVKASGLARAKDPQAYEFRAILLRYFNPVGAHSSGLIGEKPQGVPNNLMPYVTQTAKGIREKLFIFGRDYDTPDGTGVRDFIHVVDLAKGHLKALEYLRREKKSDIFNLGSGSGHSVQEIVDTFERVNGIKINYEYAERRAGDLAQSYADCSKANELLGWRTELTLEDMCRDAWNFEKGL